ncbi:serine/threonine-protein phosphatase [Fibrella sp. HMF5335]|uniref:Serine/threonine-protein phosphatase n=1 Tax=Fibrella rubiginis TaxID=2817060 RepID=A0A939GCN7_9BACT|nr:protein phosphatase 2C domain-containing protein [Fibrella rubiginis]MBO0935353.1 serine/threonine-protein phosphatase [Fibrella rubiginis]
MMHVHLAGRTDVGRQRRDNQDTFICQPIWSADKREPTEHQPDALMGNPSALLVVIDGVGGYAGGERASTIAREAILRYMETPTGDTLTMLREAVIYANNQIDQERRKEPGLSMMCCVLTAAVTDNQTNKVYYVHVGDTRLYRFRAQVVESAEASDERTMLLDKITSDHSVVGVREDANQLTEAEAMHHPRRNEVLRTVGSAPHRIDDTDFLESGETDFLPGDGLLLCSDGLTDMITRAMIKGVLRDVAFEQNTLDEQIDELIRLANEAGGQDNITVVLALNPPQPHTMDLPENKPAELITADTELTPTNELPTPVSQPAVTPPVETNADPSGNWWLIGALLAVMAAVTYFFIIR